MADRESKTNSRSVRQWKRRFHSTQNPVGPKCVPLPPPKRRRIRAQKSSPSTPIIVIDLESDDSESESVPHSTESPLRSSKTEAIDVQEPALHDSDGKLEQASDDLVLDFRDPDARLEQAFCGPDVHIKQEPLDLHDHSEQDFDDHLEQAFRDCDDSQGHAFSDLHDSLEQAFHDRDDRIEHASHDNDGHIEEPSHDGDDHIEEPSHDRDDHIEQASHDHDVHIEYASHDLNDHNDHIELVSHDHNDHTELVSRDCDDHIEQAFHDRDDILEQTSPDHDDYRELKSNDCVPVWESGQKFDPEYKFFLENMREEEKGFFLEMAAENEAIPQIIRYEISADGSSSGSVAKPPKAVRICTEKIKELPCSTKRTAFDGNARDTCVSGGNGLAVDYVMMTDGVAAESPKRGNSLDVMGEKNCRLENDEDAKDSYYIDADGLTGDCDRPVIARDDSCKWDPTYKFFLDSLREEDKGYTLDIPIVISYEMSANGFSGGLVAKMPEFLMIETEKMGSHEVEVPCSSGRNGLDVMEEENARLDYDGVVDDTNNCEMLAVGYFDGVVAETPEVERNGMSDMGSHPEEVPCSSGRYSLEAMDEDNAQLDDNGDAKDIRFADDDDLTINSEMPANDGYFDGFVAETETQNVVRNGTRDMVYNHEEVTASIERVASDVMVENNAGDHDDDAAAEANCDERHSSEVMEEKNPMLDDDGDAKDICFADNDGLTINSEMPANDGFVAEPENQNVVSNGTRDMVCNHEEVTASTERVTSDVMMENNAGLDHDDDAEANCDERHSSELMEEKNPMLGDAKYNCTDGKSLEVIEDMNRGLVGGDDSDARDICFADDGLTINSEIASNDGWYFGGFVAETETQNIVSNGSRDMVCNHAELTSSVERVTSDVMEENNAGLDHDDDVEANCDERHSSEVMEEENPLLDDVGDAKYNFTAGKSLEVIEHMNTRLVDDDDGDKDNCVSDSDGGTEVDFVSDCNGNTNGNCVPDCNGNTNGNCVPDCNNEARDNCVSDADGDGGIEVNLVSGCNVKAKGNCVSDCNGEARDNCVFGADGYGGAKEDFVPDNDPSGNCVSDYNAYSKYNCAHASDGNDDIDVSGNCPRDASCEDDCVPDGDPNGKGFPEVNGDDNRHCVSDGNEDNVEEHCVSDGDVANTVCPYGEDDVEDHCVSDSDDANTQCASVEDDVNHSISDSDDVSYRSISDADDVEYYCLSDDDDAIHSHVSISGSKYDLESDDTVDECYKLFLRCLKPDGETADFPTPKGKINRADNDHVDSDEEEKPNIDKGPNTPFAAYSSRNNTGYTGTVIRTKLSKFNDKVKFREELMDILKKPYDQNEYEKLWDEIYTRMPVEGSRVLRGKTKRYLADRAGKSYLDHHPDLASAIKSMENDKPRVLNQLRGFFYWMKNLSRQGSFIPWKDSMCLETLPET